jgi:DedD protein
MNPELKQRLIGALVVTALAAIFIPMLFDVPVDNNSSSVTELGIPPTTIKADDDLISKLPTSSKQVLKPQNTETEDPNDTDEDSEPSVNSSQAIDTEVPDESNAGNEELTGKNKKKSAKPFSSKAPDDEESLDEQTVTGVEDENNASSLDTGVVDEVNPVKKEISPGTKQAKSSRNDPANPKEGTVLKETKSKDNKSRQPELSEKPKTVVKPAQGTSSRLATLKAAEAELSSKTKAQIKTPDSSYLKQQTTKTSESTQATKTKTAGKTVAVDTAIKADEGVTVTKLKPVIKKAEVQPLKQPASVSVDETPVVAKPRTSPKKPEQPNVKQQLAENSQDTESVVKAKPLAPLKKPDITGKQNQSTTTPVSKEAKTEKSIKTGLDSKPLPELVRYYVHVGSFSQKENAFSLLESLNQQGLPVILETIKTTNKGSLYRIKIGPELDKKQADAIRIKLDKQNIKTNVIAN